MEGLLKLAETAAFVVWKNGQPYEVDDVAINLNTPPDDWPVWQFITIIHDLSGPEALKVWNKIKHLKKPKLLAPNGQTMPEGGPKLEIVLDAKKSDSPTD